MHLASFGGRISGNPFSSKLMSQLGQTCTHKEHFMHSSSFTVNNDIVSPPELNSFSFLVFFSVNHVYVEVLIKNKV